MNGAGIPPWVSADTRHILDELAHLEGVMLATQAQIDALTTRISNAATDIRSDIATIKAKLEAAGVNVDLSALEAKVAGLEGLAAENPAEPPPTP